MFLGVLANRMGAGNGNSGRVLVGANIGVWRWPGLQMLNDWEKDPSHRDDIVICWTVMINRFD